MRPTVEISSGRLQGSEESGLHVFRGIPYAAAPVGARRFLPPQPVEPWAGVRDAERHGAVAVQPPDFISNLLGLEAQPMSEDCLSLNVWTPGLDAARRPVMVWVHGGAFAMGSGSRQLTDGAALARRGDVVVVSLNYRLGAFGFLHLAGLGADASLATSNLGLLDQIAALEWVQREIATCGGDPDNVTVFGESAGAISVAMLLAMPRARGLFRRAILQSGSANLAAPAERGTRVALEFLRHLDLTAADLPRLRDVPAEQLLQAQLQLMMAPPSDCGGMPFLPVIDGDTLPADPFELIAAGASRSVDVLVGTTRDEMKLFDLIDPKAATLDEAALLRRAERILPGVDARGASLAQCAVDTYREARAARGQAVDPPVLWCAIESDRVFRYPGMRLAELQVAQQAAAYAYLFTWPSPFQGGRLGSCHALEIPFVFGTTENPHVVPFAGGGAEARRLTERMQDAWIAFARCGNPQQGDLASWPRYDPPQRATMVLDRECGAVNAPYEEERRFWAQIAAVR